VLCCGVVLQESRLFLVRNVRQGADFFRRRELLLRRARLMATNSTSTSTAS
jgi:hypothetical protein